VFIAITGYGQENDRAESTRAGFSHHLVKPVDPAKLESVLSEVASTRS
jgi:CheY-like chemotaxis protein